MNGWWAVPRRRPNLFLVVYHLRYEIGVAAGALGLVQLGAATHFAAPSAILMTAAVALVWSRSLRVRLAARCQVVLVQHRLRSAFRGAAVVAFSGRAPAILWTSPRPAGVRVILSLPAGLEAADLRAARDTLAAACLAADVLVERHERYANLVVLYVVTKVPAP